MKLLLILSALALSLTANSYGFPKIPEQEGADNLKAFGETFSNLAEWQARAKRNREGILKGAGLVPLPKRTPLNPYSHSRKEMNGYSVENVRFESLPGFFVTGNLYRPLRKGGLSKFAGILCPHGHSKEGRMAEYTQARCASLARMGAIVFAYDMVGWNDDSQHVNHRNDKNVFAFQTWNSMRALDYLLTFREVDPNRIGVTGESGGGTQTFILTALDPRVRVAAPVVMASAHFYGGCNCESGMPIHESKTHKTNNAEIAAMAAPRPLLLVSVGGDWTKNTPKVEFPYARKIYSMFGAINRVENFHLADEKHGYEFSKRKPVYRFFAKILKLRLSQISGDDDEITEDFFKPLPKEKLVVFNEEHPRPKHSLDGSKACLAALRKAQGR
ncbi:MAG: acetylxylan esterase [Opitutales bacterium]